MKTKWMLVTLMLAIAGLGSANGKTIIWVSDCARHGRDRGRAGRPGVGGFPDLAGLYGGVSQAGVGSRRVLPDAGHDQAGGLERGGHGHHEPRLQQRRVRQ